MAKSGNAFKPNEQETGNKELIRNKKVLINVKSTLFLFYIFYLSQSLLVFFLCISRVQTMLLSISYSSQSFYLYTKHLFEDSPRSQYLLNAVIVALSDNFLMFSTMSFFTVPSASTNKGITSVFICHFLCISSSSLCTCFFFQFPSVQRLIQCNGTVILISLQLEFGESSMMISGLFAFIVPSVLTGMSHMMMMLFS